MQCKQNQFLQANTYKRALYWETDFIPRDRERIYKSKSHQSTCPYVRATIQLQVHKLFNQCVRTKINYFLTNLKYKK